MRKLDFLIAGVQKGGTTALWHFLKQHPQIRFGPRKEMHFFDDESLNWTDPDYEILHRQYADAPEDCLLGDATPIYMFWPNALQRIAAYNPKMRLVVLLRDPIERAFSNWRMENARGAEPLPFDSAIRSGRDRVALSEQNMRVFSYVERGLYCDQISRMKSLFGENILLISQNEMRNRHQPTMSIIYDFLQIESIKTTNYENIFVNSEIILRIVNDDYNYLNEIYYREKETYGEYFI